MIRLDCLISWQWLVWFDCVIRSTMSATDVATRCCCRSATRRTWRPHKAERRGAVLTQEALAYPHSINQTINFFNQVQSMLDPSSHLSIQADQWMCSTLSLILAARSFVYLRLFIRFGRPAYSVLNYIIGVALLVWIDLEVLDSFSHDSWIIGQSIS